MIRLYSIFSALMRIWTHPFNKKRAPGRVAISAVYLKLRFLATMSILFKLKFTEVQLFGYEWKFCEVSSLLYVFEEIFIERSYDIHKTDSPELIIDAGSNIGLATLFFKLQFPNAKVFCFEPDQKAFAILKENISRNQLKKVTLYQAALSSSTAPVTLYLENGRVGSVGTGTTAKSLGQVSHEVEGTILSKYLNQPVDFLKIDIEGAEYESLLEAKDILANIREMVIECHHRPDIAKNFESVLSLLSSKGFSYRVSSQSPRYAFAPTKGQDVLVHAVQP